MWSILPLIYFFPPQKSHDVHICNNQRVTDNYGTDKTDKKIKAYANTNLIYVLEIQ